MSVETPDTRSNTIQLTLDDMAFEGAALGRSDGQVVFADYGIPDEEVIVEIESSKRHFLVGRVVEVLTPAESRVEPPCPYFGRCGGCQWQHIDYPEQLRLKQHVLHDQLRRIGKIEDPPVSPTVGSPNPYGYRNNARFSTDEDGSLGFITRGPAGREFLRIDECIIMNPRINDILARLQGHGAGLHQVVIRLGENTGDVFIQPDLSERTTEVESGQPGYAEDLLGERFTVSAPSFFQTNTKQAETLVRLTAERLELTGEETVIDAYAGVGTIAKLLAPQAGRVVAIEESAAAVLDAKQNVAGIANIEYHQGKVEHVLDTLDITPESIILDPPRAGCHKRTLRAVLKFRPRKLIYISCNPSTLARDLRTLIDGGYELKDVTPVDMFPQTYHIESVSLLEFAGG